MSYYKNFDTIGLISLNDWYVIDFPLKNYDENGNEIESAASTSFLSGNTGEIAYSSDGTPSRGMASIDVTLPINYEVDTNMLEKSSKDWIATSKYNIGLHIQKENIQSVVCSFFRWIKREMLEWDIFMYL